MGSKKFWLRRAHKVPVKTNYRVLKILENIQRSRGFQTEERFIKAIENGNGNNPLWYKGISQATKKEDRKGIDFIIHTLFGNVFVQIKSSETGAKKFLKKRQNQHRNIILLVIKGYYSEETIRYISFLAIEEKIDSFKKPSC